MLGKLPPRRPGAQPGYVVPIYLYLSYAVLGRRWLAMGRWRWPYRVTLTLLCFVADVAAAAGGRKVIRLEARDVADIVAR